MKIVCSFWTSSKRVHNYAFAAPLFACGTFLSVFAFFKESTAKRVFWGSLMGFAPEIPLKIGIFTGRPFLGDDW